MCGICGFTGAGTNDDLIKMNRRMNLRGPDDEGYWNRQKKAIFLAHRRLSIIDLAGGHQPMFLPDQSIGVTFNGEIYNHRELRQELEQAGHKFISSNSDTEVLLHGYKAWGNKLPEKLNGMWAFAIYDHQKNELFISRDRFGKKPLYYTRQKNTFAFASELSSLLCHSSISARVSTLSQVKYFAYGFIPSPLSLYENIYKLPGGHNLMISCDNMKFKLKRYWEYTIRPFETIPKNPLETWGEELRYLLAQAVRRRMEADVPLGIFLSGGIDSSAVTFYAADSSRTIYPKTFSIGFDESSFDESKKALRISKLLKTDHTCESFTLKKARHMAQTVSERLDEPMGDSSLLPTFLLCQGTRKHVTVALGGDGADELFAGYDPFKALAAATIYRKVIPQNFHKAIRAMVNLLPVSHNNMSPDFKLKRTLQGLSYDPVLWNPVWLGPLCPRELSRIFGAPLCTEEIYSEAINSWNKCGQENLLDKTTQFFIDLYLQDNILVKLDRASMMNSLEVRSPYLDIDFVNFARKIPATFRYRYGNTKYLLKSALLQILPREVVHQKKKGFGIPVGHWFKSGGLRFSQDQMSAFPFRSYLENALKEHCRGKANHRLFLWNAWLLSKHLQRTGF